MMEPWQEVSGAGKGVDLADGPGEERVRAAMGGDVDSFVTLCRHYYPALVAIAHSVLKDRHLAEDAAQETLAKACLRLGGLRSPDRFGAWLAAICRNEARDMLRRRPRVESLGERDVPEIADEADADVEAVRDAVDALSVESRELLYLRYRSGLGYEAIADLLGIPVQAVHGRLRRAREEVREQVLRDRKRRLS
jgi:RNA polymerase sigma factor (sigma-70 family)